MPEVDLMPLLLVPTHHAGARDERTLSHSWALDQRVHMDQNLGKVSQLAVSSHMTAATPLLIGHCFLIIASMQLGICQLILTELPKLNDSATPRVGVRHLRWQLHRQ